MRACRAARAASFALGAAMAFAAAAGERGGEATGGLTVTRTLVARLAGRGRGEAGLSVALGDPLGGPPQVQRGRLALEPPDRLRLDFPATGERIALRGDGGEWVQPAVRQMVRIRREQAALAAWLWEVLLKGGSERFVERKTGERRFVLAPREPTEGLPERLTVRLDARGLPAALEIDDPAGAGVHYRFSGWRFSRARGAPSFVLTPPVGYTVVDLP